MPVFALDLARASIRSGDSAGRMTRGLWPSARAVPLPSEGNLLRQNSTARAFGPGLRLMPRRATIRSSERLGNLFTLIQCAFAQRCA